ncbi:hypothetical protein Ddye_021452 [Dipteronia dyeriana]|uniref:Uncharacterized protein n=1 Tax=Dipteronia dyeriana TaxID=168575 RepID=A0AAD9U291_9ROSI|nr:hypothetical protein Ddye_021452 [Dipteronia dyeriana]
MGTKIEYAIDPLASAIPNGNSFTTVVHGVDDWQYFQTRELIKNKPLKINFRYYSMDRTLEKHNIESIKKTMQIHEDIFKYQVKELHRLYRVQKTLMSELQKEVKQSRIWSNHSHKFIKQNHATAQHSKERSGSCSGGEAIRITTPSRGFDLERPAAMDEDQVGPSSQSPTNLIRSNVDEDNSSEVELRLSIGVSPSSSSKKRSSNYMELDSSSSFKSDRGDHQDFSAPNTPMSSSSATFDQENKKNMPHWLLGLSISRS